MTRSLLAASRSRFFAESLVRLNRIALLRVILAAAVTFASRAEAGQDVSLAWAPSHTPDVMGYALYYGTLSKGYDNRLDVGTNTSAIVSNLSCGATYFFAAVAYDSEGAESVPSDEVCFTVPMPLLFQQISKEGATLVLSWAAISGQSYQLEYTTDLNQMNWLEWGSPITATNPTASLVVDIGPEPQRFYRLRVVP